jgi:hypothetical protein
MAELKAAKQQQRFGSVRDIGRADFVREVSNAGADVHVVVHLHQDGCAAPLTKVANALIGAAQQLACFRARAGTC